MNDLISRSALIEAFRKSRDAHANTAREYLLLGRFIGITYAQPEIEAAPVVHGYNDNQTYHEVDEFRCSVCGLHLEDWSRHVYNEELDEEFIKEYSFKYCPECGAKID